jgi:hypothetical protein
VAYSPSCGEEVLSERKRTPGAREAGREKKRVGGQCAVGSSIRSIDANGLVTCDDIALGGVGSAEVANGGLDLVDVAEWNGTTSLNPPSINAQSCTLVDMQIPDIDPGARSRKQSVAVPHAK